MTNSPSVARYIALPFIVALSCGIAHAASVTPGSVQQSVQPTRAMPIDQSVQLPELIGNAARPAAVAPGGTPISVNSVDFTGNTKVPSAALQSRVAQFVGKSVTLAELYGVAQDLTRFYQSQGYPLASVNVPVQRVDGGRLLLEVTEGRIGKVRIEGQKFYKSEALQQQLRELISGDVVTTARLERELLLLNDLPGIEARVVVLPGAEAGTSDLVIKISEDSFSFYAGADNHGRDDLGENRFSFNTSLNGLGRGDDLTINLTHSEANLLNYGRVAYGVPIGTDGGRFTASYLISDFSVGTPAFAVLEPGGRSNTARGEYSFPLIRSRSENKVITVAYSTTQSETEALGVITGTSEIQLIEIALYGNRVLGDRNTFSYTLGYSGNAQFNEGGLDNEQCCRLFGDMALTLPVGQNWYSKTKLRGQWSPDSVADIERFSLGGPYSVRGYEASELRGDTGFDAAYELHRPFNLFGGRADALVFIDAGQVSLNFGGNAVQSDVLGSIGAGFTVFDLYGFECNLQWAMAVGGLDPADGERKGRGYVSFGTRF